MKAPISLRLVAVSLAALACARPDQAGEGAEPVKAGNAAVAMPATPATAGDPGGAPAPGGSAEPVDGAGAGLPAAQGAADADTGTQPGAGDQAPADSAGRVLERAAARYRSVETLQAEFSMSYDNPLLRSRSEGTGVLYQKRPDRLLLRFSEPAGDLILSDGRYFWVYYPSVDPAQVLRSEAEAGGSSGVDLQAQFLGDPTQRFEYALEGQEQVAGRPAWQLTLKPRERLGYRQLRVWIDQRDHLARRFEITEENGSVRRFELRGLRLNGALADDLFEFQLPAGVRVVGR